MQNLNHHKKIKIGITIGDVNGIGIEVLFKSLLDNRILDLCIPIVYGSSKIASLHRKALGIHDFSFNIVKDVEQINPKRVNLINCWEEDVIIQLGKDTDIGGQYALKSLEWATKDILLNKIDALVTAPLNKHNIPASAQDPFYGHTEYFQAKANVKDSLMLLMANNLRVGVLTTHIPLKDVAGSINQEKIINKLTLMNKCLRNDFWISKPKIAVLALNPHAGDGGLLGDEEQTIITPAIENACKKNILAFGPYPADSFFGKELYTAFDATLAMYHDQGLAPFKTLSFGFGVNFTAGLPFVRTSPDHGVGYDIAGKGIANESSFREAIYQAIDIFRRRSEQATLSANTLPVGKTKLKTTNEDQEE